LTKRDGYVLNWSAAQTCALATIKNLVTQASVLAFYNPEEGLTLENDASENGVGSVLSQDS
jgi:hypothetical protein